MKEEEPAVALVTEDKWLRQNGFLDASDWKVISEASRNGRFRVRMMNMEQMLEAMQEEDPKQFAEFKKKYEQDFGKSLTFKELVELSSKASARMEEFEHLAKNMTRKQAKQIRIFRMDHRMTWRSVARACHSQMWSNLCGWYPPSNQIMGMVLCAKAASFFKEDFIKPPWN
jgi:hypothetical protein